MQSEEKIPLLPYRRWPRLSLLAVSAPLAYVTSETLLDAVSLVAAIGLLLGSYPIAYALPSELEKSVLVMFFPVRSSRRPWRDFDAIETDVDIRIGTWVYLPFGLRGPFWMWIVNALFPWWRGEYKIWLRTRAGAHVLAWRGDGDDRFRDNLKVLKGRSGLQITRR